MLVGAVVIKPVLIVITGAADTNDSDTAGVANKLMVPIITDTVGVTNETGVAGDADDDAGDANDSGDADDAGNANDAGDAGDANDADDADDAGDACSNQPFLNIM